MAAGGTDELLSVEQLCIITRDAGLCEKRGPYSEGG
jgi:hypothetical protein